LDGNIPVAVANVFDGFPSAVRERLKYLRRLILKIAAESHGVGPLTETLKWGEPAYLTEATRSGSAIRLGWPKAHPDQAALYFNCKTSLVSTFRDLFSESLIFVGNRAILLPLEGPIAEAELEMCIGMALTYKRTKT
jgi:Domain of unknown function (DU1801)